MIVKPGTFCSTDFGESCRAGEMLLAVDEQLFMQRIGQLGRVAIHDQQQCPYGIQARSPAPDRSAG